MIHLSVEYLRCENWAKRNWEMMRRERQYLSEWGIWIDHRRVSLRNKRERARNQEKEIKTKECKVNKNRNMQTQKCKTNKIGECLDTPS
jgi:hypothetical protein